MTEVLLRYPTQEIDIPLSRRTLRITAVRSVEELLTEQTSAEDIPFWALPWHAAVGLSEYLCSHPELVRDKHVIELGAGLGICGIVAQWLGAQVTLNDYQHDALEFALWNAKRNGVIGLQTLLADWRSFPEVAPYEVLLAADVLYERRLHGALADILHRITLPNSHVLIADPWRDAAWQFMDEMEAMGWHVEYTGLDVRMLSEVKPVVVFSLRPPKHRL